jgi:hypothetical protein
VYLLQIGKSENNTSNTFLSLSKKSLEIPKGSVVVFTEYSYTTLWQYKWNYVENGVKHS